MLEIDAASGEGGGQILRTALSLSAISGRAVRLSNIRAGRPKPGLAAQHLTAVRATASLCRARVRGDVLGSMFLEFCPQCPAQAGDYTFDVAAARTGGSAGAVTLILQSLLLPLALAVGDSRLILKGGTHVPWSPSVTYLETVYLPLLRRQGLEAAVKLRQWGWYPAGGGEVEVSISGGSQLQGLQLLTRQELQEICGLAVAAQLPQAIPQRLAQRAQDLLQQAGYSAQIQVLPAPGPAPGAGFFLTADYGNSRAGFSALGKRGLPAERLAAMAVAEFLEFDSQQAPVDAFLGDQLLLPLALAGEKSQYRPAKITRHLTTNAWVIQQFGLATITINPESQIVEVIGKKSGIEV